MITALITICTAALLLYAATTCAVCVGCFAMFAMYVYLRAVPDKIFGIYSRPGVLYWLKVLIFYMMLKVRRLKAQRHVTSSGKTSGYGVKSRSNAEEMECPQKLSDHPKAIDAVYFNAANREGFYFVAATARRPHGVINGLLYLRIPKLGLLQLPKMPDTMLFGNGESFEAEGLQISCLEAMQKWSIKYAGNMRMPSNDEVFNVELNVIWSASGDHFDFDTDMHAGALARSMALEPWSREYFQTLKDAHQTHYEQMGSISGIASVNGQEYSLHLDSMRDHSYGHKREWKLMHRYGLHMINTEDGLQANVGIVSQPSTCSQLELGYVCLKGKVLPVERVNLPLWQHGEGGTPPVDYAFSFTCDGQEYFVEVKVVESPHFYIGWEWETKVFERMATFRVNGVPGWGLAEWDYRHHKGRPKEFADKDPQFCQDIAK